MSETVIRRTVRVSERAYQRIKEIIKLENDTYRGRGAVGVIDQLLFDTFTTDRRGPKKKNVDKR